MWLDYRRGKNKNICSKCWKTNNFYILLAFLLVTIALLIAVSIYCYLIKDKSKQKDLLPYYVTNDKLTNDELINILWIWIAIVN